MTEKYITLRQFIEKFITRNHMKDQLVINYERYKEAIEPIEDYALVDPAAVEFSRKIYYEYIDLQLQVKELEEQLQSATNTDPSRLQERTEEERII